ncbi:ROK family protein [Deinococcus sp.]|uniref:ROK family protein n=1 Tax=Deinococcus sp. TaxID=47478 RepID=UPI0025F54F0A|nr:ROK family protein [Deinococcus sp.]
MNRRAPAQSPKILGLKTLGLKILVVDIGGTHVKLRLSGQEEVRRFDSGPEMTPAAMMKTLLKLIGDWSYTAVSVGYPGPVLHGRPLHDPVNLGAGWMGFDFAGAFGAPVKLINDAAMQALGSGHGGSLLFLGLGTGLGSAMVVDGRVEPMELAHLPYRKHTFEDYVGLRGLKKRGKKRWIREVLRVIAALEAALEPDEVVLGGGNAALMPSQDLPAHVRLGDNANAFLGGFRLWDDLSAARTPKAGP